MSTVKKTLKAIWARVKSTVQAVGRIEVDNNDSDFSVLDFPNLSM